MIPYLIFLAGIIVLALAIVGCMLWSERNHIEALRDHSRPKSKHIDT